ncbi:hypothetical protein [Shewanella fodinae]|jgi:hypothetical protein|uniref:Uncharacterized protein n=1 Tax=Shewanella fodinae TaxID=552357 RepID=A0A4R2F2T0_9GAMM|nr:hypothetical protein [Shewanella fodinae]MDN5369596.1 hypothetical protein [Shewanella sp.]TCN77711.1 hypothetical protein EDC91_14412 [Shewanella fodinae]
MATLANSITPTSAAQTAYNPDWMSTINSTLANGLNLYQQYTQIELMKDASGQAQKELASTPETPNPNTNVTAANPVAVTNAATAAKQQVQNALAGLQIGTGTIMVIFIVIGVLWWLSRK